jgi:ribosomal protein S18 acetylase RimI-like enzyme
LILREFTEKDIDEITSLMKSLCSIKGQQFNEDRWRTSLQNRMNQDSNAEVIVALDDHREKVIGMAQCSIKQSDKGYRFGYISNLIVREEERRSGVGEKIINYIIDLFRRNHIKALRLSLSSDLDEAAKILFTKLGFKEIFRVYEKIIN